MNILITGVRGFIGRNLVDRLALDKNLNVIGLSNKNDDVLEKKCRFIVSDLTATNELDCIPKHINIIIHLAQSNRYRDCTE